MSENGGVKLKPVSIQRGERVLPEMINFKKFLSEDIKNFLKGLPPMIRQNGLGQTFAFLLCKGKDSDKGTAYKEVVNILAKMLFHTEDIRIPDGLMGKIFGLGVDKYLYLQQEAVEYAGWIKKFAVAFYGESITKEAKGDTTPPK